MPTSMQQLRNTQSRPSKKGAVSMQRPRRTAAGVGGGRHSGSQCPPGRVASCENSKQTIASPKPIAAQIFVHLVPSKAVSSRSEVVTNGGDKLNE